MTESTGCPGLEQLALFVDGELEGEERAMVAAHVEGCARCYEVVVSTAALLDDPAAGISGDSGAKRGVASGARAEVVSIERGGRRRPTLVPRIAAAAALVVLAVALLVWLTGRPGALDRSSGSLAAGIAADRLGQDWHAHGWSNFRGGRVDRVDDAQAFRLGVLMVDLTVAQRSGDSAEPLLAGLQRSLAETALGAPIVEALRAGETDAAERALADWLGGWFGAGRATESARLLAVAGEAAAARELLADIEREAIDLPGGEGYRSELSRLRDTSLAAEALAAELAALVNAAASGPIPVR